MRLFDLDSVRTRYRVFLFPGGLQVDLSLTPGAVAQMGPKLRPLFGTAIAEVDTPPHDPREVFGLCVHHALRARLGIERGRLWSAEYYVAELRNETLALACLRRDLPSRYARGFDALPLDVRVLAQDSLVRSLEPAELLRALRAAIALLVAEAGDVDALAAVRPTLDELGAPSLARA